jgi:hypothetical protein
MNTAKAKEERDMDTRNVVAILGETKTRQRSLGVPVRTGSELDSAP